MRRLFCIFVIVMLSVLPVSAAETDLTLRLEAMKERQPTYTSITDLYGLDMLTPESAEMGRQYKLFLDNLKRQEISGLFLSESVQQESDEQRIQERALELGLFSRERERQYFRQDDTRGYSSPGAIFTIGIIIALCLCGFLFSNYMHQRKMRRKTTDVHNRNHALA